MIAILTDFGFSEYLGVMKGVIYSAYPEAKIADLCSTISPQNITEGAWVLLQGYRFFPKGTVFLCVIDPGVGTARKPIIIETGDFFFVGPDNGLMYPAASAAGMKSVYAVEQGTEASATFHGRDVFAPAAAMLDKGVSPEEIGVQAGKIAVFGFHLEGREGAVVRVDTFGNIITNLTRLGKLEYSVRIRDNEYPMRLYRTYEEAGKGLFIVEGSSGTLEISAKNSSANEIIRAVPGDKIKIF